MELVFDVLGRLMYSRRQRWEQRRQARTLVFTVAVALAFGVGVGAMIGLMYYQRR